MLSTCANRFSRAHCLSFCYATLTLTIRFRKVHCQFVPVSWYYRGLSQNATSPLQFCTTGCNSDARDFCICDKPKRLMHVTRSNQRQLCITLAPVLGSTYSITTHSSILESSILVYDSQVFLYLYAFVMELSSPSQSILGESTISCMGLECIPTPVCTRTMHNTY